MTVTKEYAERIQKIMKNLEVTEEEAKEILQSDKEIDKGAKLFELSPEKEKASKQARITTGKKEKVDAYGKKTTRTKVINNDKVYLVEIIKQLLETENCEVNIINPEREFEFHFRGTKYKIVMSVPRK